MKPKWKHGSTRDYQVNHPNNLAKPFAAGQNFMRSPCHLKFASTSDNQAAHNPFESLELNGDQLSRIEVPPPLTAQQYLDISESRPGMNAIKRAWTRARYRRMLVLMAFLDTQARKIAEAIPKQERRKREYMKGIITGLGIAIQAAGELIGMKADQMEGKKHE